MLAILRVFSYLSRYRLLATGQLLCAVIMTIMLFIFPKVTGYIVDNIIGNPNAQTLLYPWIFLVALGFIIREGMNALRIFLNNYFEQQVIFDIRSDLYQKIQYLPLPWFHQLRTGDIMTRVVEDVTSMERVLIDGIEQGLIAILQVFGIGIYLYILHPYVAIWATLPVPFLLFGAWIYSTKGKDRYTNQRNQASLLNAILHDNISGIQQIKAFVAEEKEHQRFNTASDALRKATLRMMKWWAIYSPSMSFLRMIGHILTLLFGSLAVMQGEMAKGELITFLLFLNLFYEPIDKLNGLNQMLLSGKASAKRVFEILDTPEELNATQGQSFPNSIMGDVRFHNVSFSYQEQLTLRNINLEVPIGKTIALVGTTGAGKSTLLSLLNRFYEIQQGSITIDGIDISTVSKYELRRHISYVTQEPFLFNGSIRDNLLFAKSDATEEELWSAVQSANAAVFIEKLPELLDTQIGERGVKLSGGEKQRLSIARALLKDSPILLLDEATAAVDSETEHQIQQALELLMKNRSSIIIAHRLSTIQHAHCIYVMESGTIIEKGNHLSLINSNTKYKELCEKSFLNQTIT